ncbi:MAG: hypothetical protein NVS9B15_16220 [Acidobacteriaceae bacterium]
MSELSSERISMTRRAFTRVASFSLAAAVVCPVPLSSIKEVGLPISQKPEIPALGAGQQQEVEARWNNIMRKYGSRFTERQKVRLRHILMNNERMMQPVREFSLRNGDTPASVLKLYAPSEIAK